MDNIISINKLDMDMIYFDKPEFVDNQYMNIKLWYNFSGTINDYDNLRLETFFIKLNKQKIYEKNKNELMFYLSPDNILGFEQFDKQVIKHIQDSKLLKKLNLKGTYTYRTLVNEVNITNQSMQGIQPNQLTQPNIKLLRCTMLYNSKIYNNAKQIIPNNTTNKYIIKNSICNLILEPDSVIIDLKHKTIYTNLKIQQMLILQVHMPKPKKIELCDYAFVDSDSEPEPEFGFNPEHELDESDELDGSDGSDESVGSDDSDKLINMNRLALALALAQAQAQAQSNDLDSD